MGMTQSSSSSSSSRNARALIDEEIQRHAVVIFAKSWCGYCSSAIRTLNAYQPVIYQLDQRNDGLALQEELTSMTGQRTVPNIFVHGRHVGGNDDIQRLQRQGKLEELIKAKL